MSFPPQASPRPLARPARREIPMHNEQKHHGSGVREALLDSASPMTSVDQLVAESAELRKQQQQQQQQQRQQWTEWLWLLIVTAGVHLLLCLSSGQAGSIVHNSLMRVCHVIVGPAQIQ